MPKIIVPINNHPELNYARVIVFEGVQYLFYSLETAELVWLEYPADAQGNPIESDIIKPRSVITPISNENRVTTEGILITEEYIRSQNPKGTAETDEEYDKRIQGLYESALSTGLKEYDYWVGKVAWDPIVKGAANLLTQFKRWDRK